MKSICFYAWNQYQLRSLKQIADLTNGTIALEDRGYNGDFIQTAVSEIDTSKTIRIKRGSSLDKLEQFDVIVAHTAFSRVGELRSAKLAFLQYGLAKEAYNYGLWRGLADVNFVFGEYSKAKIKNISNTFVVGHPVLSQLRLLTGSVSAKRPHKETILYAPTWGVHSSFQHCIAQICELTNKYNVIIAPHHNSLTFSNGEKFKIPPDVRVSGVDIDHNDALLEADIVISDYSGIIFEAFYLGKKVLVYRDPKIPGISEKIDPDSLEIKYIDRFAKIISDVRLLADVENFEFPELAGQEFYDEIIHDNDKAHETVAERLLDFNVKDENVELRNKIKKVWCEFESERSSLKKEVEKSNFRKRSWLRRVYDKVKST